MDTEDSRTMVGPMVKDITELCDFCIEFTKLIVRLPEDLGTTGDQPNRIDEFVPGRGLESCQLCEVISSIEPTTPADLRTSLIRSGFASRNRSFEQRDRVCGTHIRGKKFRIWADIGSPACKTLVGRPPVSDLPMHQIRDLIQHWRKRCRVHKHCQLEAKTPMPTRVLALYGDHAQPSIRLVKSKGMKGRYLALSHCWGSVEKQPLRTTPTNFKEYQKGIAFEDLPRTFQDLVNIARSIGIRYIWIDSLCIIQGNSRDWHSEAAKMGDVYRNAAFVIAASGAEDSSQGLFINNRIAEKAFRLPYRINDEVEGTFNMVQSPEESDWHPAHGPLEKRAWALQERYLAQRLITFMPRGITWKCNSISVNEAGESFLDFSRNKSWALLLIKYTRRSLTFPSDRTEAILGVAEEFQRSRTDRYIPDYGVWENQLTNQLLWFKDGPFFDNDRLSHKPSWSWITTGSAKIWPQMVYFVDSDGTTSVMPPSTWTTVGSAKMRPQKVLAFESAFLETISNELIITSGGDLQVLGHLSTVRPAPSYVRDRYTARDLQVSAVQALYDSWSWSEQPASSYILTQNIDDDYDQTNLGMARFDNDAMKSYSHVWFLGKQPINSDYGLASRYYGDQRGSRKPFVKGEFIDDVVYHTEHNPGFVYWALLLERVDESRYKRVGIATLLPVAYKAFQMQLQKFQVI